MRDVPSPNFDERDPKIALQYIVLHYTGMKDAESALKRLCDPAAKVSAHYMIDENGEVFCLVDEAKRAWHAGQSFWRGIKDMNSASIGIELVNPGHEFGYRDFSKAQIESLKKLLHEIIARRGLNPATALLAHSDIAPTRKQDPGELFPWEELAKDGLGLWPEPTEQDFMPASEDEVAEALDFIGYDPKTHAASLLAFQRRFCPSNMTDIADAETVARLKAYRRQITKTLDMFN